MYNNWFEVDDPFGVEYEAVAYALFRHKASPHRSSLSSFAGHDDSRPREYVPQLPAWSECMIDAHIVTGKGGEYVEIHILPREAND